MIDGVNALFFRFNRLNTVSIVFLLTMANFFGLTLEGGEEQYFAFAKQYMDPMWMPHSFTLNHPAGGNLAFQVIVGYLLKFVSFEQMAIWGRTINFLLYAFPLTLIFKKLKISNIEVIFLLQVVFFSHQSLYAGEWIFKNFEEKTIAYIFVFWSLYYLLISKPVISSIFAALATWFHFLVGGWMFFFVFAFVLFGQRNVLRSVITGIFYTLLVLPLIFYLHQTYMVDNPDVINGVNTNAVYAFWRLKHHIGMFRDPGYFFSNVWWGVLLTLGMFAICIRFFSKINHPQIRLLNILNIIIFSQQFLFMIIGLFDKEGVLMKTYPFRTNSLSVFVFLLELTLVLKYYLSGRLYRTVVEKYLTRFAYPNRKKIFSNALNTLLLMVALPVLYVESVSTVKNLNSLQGDLDQDMLALIGYVKENTPGSAVFIFPDSDRPHSFIRRAERERFVVVKFTPTKSAAIYEWYNRAMLKELLKKDIARIDSIKAVYQLDYLVSDSLYGLQSLELEKQFGAHHLFRISKD